MRSTAQRVTGSHGSLTVESTSKIRGHPTRSRRAVAARKTTQCQCSTPLVRDTRTRRGYAKFKIFQKSKIKLDGVHPTHPHQFFFGIPSLTWTEGSNHNNQQLLAMPIQTAYTWYTTPKYQNCFRAILGRFSTKINSE